MCVSVYAIVLTYGLCVRVYVCACICVCVCVYTFEIIKYPSLKHAEYLFAHA